MGKPEPPPNNSSNTSDDWVLIGRIVGAHGLNGHVKVYPESDFPERFVKPGDRWIQKKGGIPTPVRLTSGRYLEGKNNYLVKLAGVDHRDQAEDLRSAQLLVPAGDRLPLDPGEFHVNDLIGLSVILKESQANLGTVTNIFTTGHDLLEVTLALPTEERRERSSAEAVSQIDKPEATEENAGPLENNASPKTTDSTTAQGNATNSLRAKAARKLRRKAKREKKKKKPKTLLIPFVEEIVPIVDIQAGHIKITPPPGLIDLA